MANRGQTPEEFSGKAPAPRPVKPEAAGPAQSDQPAPGRQGDRPFVGEDRKPRAKEPLRFPARPVPEPMTPGPLDPAREAEREAFAARPHDPSLDYRPPNPALVVPPVSFTMKILGAILGLMFLMLVLLLLFHNFMTPSPRQPGQQPPQQPIQQKPP